VTSCIFALTVNREKCSDITILSVEKGRRRSRKIYGGRSKWI